MFVCRFEYLPKPIETVLSMELKWHANLIALRRNSIGIDIGIPIGYLLPTKP